MGYYLPEKWKYYKGMYRTLDKMPPNSDKSLLGDKAIEEGERMGVKRLKKQEELSHIGMTLNYIIDTAMDFLNIKDKEKAKSDVQNFYSRYFIEEGD